MSLKDSNKTMQDPKYGYLKIIFNPQNTIFHVTDITGTFSISLHTGGMETTKDSEKDTPYNGIKMLSKALKKIEEYQLYPLIVTMRSKGGIFGKYHGFRYTGVFPSVAKMIFNAPFQVYLADVTPIPHDGTKRKYGRRGRRV